MFSTCRTNFINVEIFYEALSNQVMEQNKAFEFLSLLSEVGGFMGLLLGASVLTVCEMVDFVIVSIVHRMSGRM